ncbi:hypothetical protein ACP70R_045251 [Stipagrostis hirtigluma subsp. patula]
MWSLATTPMPTLRRALDVAPCDDAHTLLRDLDVAPHDDAHVIAPARPEASCSRMWPHDTTPTMWRRPEDASTAARPDAAMDATNCGGPPCLPWTAPGCRAVLGGADRQRQPSAWSNRSRQEHLRRPIGFRWRPTDGTEQQHQQNVVSDRCGLHQPHCRLVLDNNRRDTSCCSNLPPMDGDNR